MNPTGVQRRNLHLQPSGLGGEDVNVSEPPALAQYSAATPVIVAPPVPPFVAEAPVSDSEPPVMVPSVYESAPRPATVPSAVAGVMPVDEFLRLLIEESPALRLGESHVGQGHIND